MTPIKATLGCKRVKKGGVIKMLKIKKRVLIFIIILNIILILLAGCTTYGDSNTINIDGDINVNQYNANVGITVSPEDNNKKEPSAPVKQYDADLPPEDTPDLSDRATQPLMQTLYDTNVSGLYSSVKTNETVSMGGSEYKDAIVFYTKDGYAEFFVLYNLNGQYARLSGYIGREDGSDKYNAVFNFYGDGELLCSYEINAEDLPKQILLNVTGVQQLKIEVNCPEYDMWDGKLLAEPHKTNYVFANATLIE